MNIWENKESCRDSRNLFFERQVKRVVKDVGNSSHGWSISSINTEFYYIFMFVTANIKGETLERYFQR